MSIWNKITIDIYPIIGYTTFSSTKGEKDGRKNTEVP